MDQLIQNTGFHYIVQNIFACLDYESLCTCRLVCRSWCYFLDHEKFNWIRILQGQSDKIKPWLDHNKDWSQVIQDIANHGRVQDVKKMVVILRPMKTSCLNFGITPLHQAVYVGDFETVKFLLALLKRPKGNKLNWTVLS